MKKIRTVVLISGSGSNLQALIDAGNAADYPAEVVAVISNRADVYASSLVFCLNKREPLFSLVRRNVGSISVEVDIGLARNCTAVS